MQNILYSEIISSIICFKKNMKSQKLTDENLKKLIYIFSIFADFVTCLKKKPWMYSNIFL